jgi:hypothetical protein
VRCCHRVVQRKSHHTARTRVADCELPA